MKLEQGKKESILTLFVNYYNIVPSEQDIDVLSEHLDKILNTIENTPNWPQNEEDVYIDVEYVRKLVRESEHRKFNKLLQEINTTAYNGNVGLVISTTTKNRFEYELLSRGFKLIECHNPLLYKISWEE